MRRADGKSTSHILETIALDMAIKALEQEPCDDIKEYYKDIWDCDINHPRYEDTVAEIVEKSYMSGYVQGVENTAKEFRFELEQEPCEDAVNRKAVLDKAWDVPYEGRYIQVVDVGDIEELPPVTPSHKKGKWVKVTNGRGGHECNICHAYAPSCQNGDEYLSEFCPNCGSFMTKEN